MRIDRVRLGGQAGLPVAQAVVGDVGDAAVPGHRHLEAGDLVRLHVPGEPLLDPCQPIGGEPDLARLGVHLQLTHRLAPLGRLTPGSGRYRGHGARGRRARSARPGGEDRGRLERCRRHRVGRTHRLPSARPGTSARCDRSAVLVTGATGYIGGRLVPELLDAGYEVRCLARTPAKLDDAEWRDRVEVVRATSPTPRPSGPRWPASTPPTTWCTRWARRRSFEQHDREAAGTFRDAAADAGIGAHRLPRRPRPRRRPGPVPPPARAATRSAVSSPRGRCR